MNKMDIDIEELKQLVKEGAILIDVRSPQEYKEGHIDNAICIPEYEIIYKCRQKIKDKNQVIVLYCSSGKRSKRAQEELTRAGYSRVYDLYKGIDNYNN